MKQYTEMSAIGPKRTSASAPHMSAFGGKGDMARPPSNPLFCVLTTVPEFMRVPVLIYQQDSLAVPESRNFILCF
jgi:hypothetical protein